MFFQNRSRIAFIEGPGADLDFDTIFVFQDFKKGTLWIIFFAKKVAKAYW